MIGLCWLARSNKGKNVFSMYAKKDVVIRIPAGCWLHAKINTGETRLTLGVTAPKLTGGNRIIPKLEELEVTGVGQERDEEFIPAPVSPGLAQPDADGWGLFEL